MKTILPTSVAGLTLTALLGCGSGDSAGGSDVGWQDAAAECKNCEKLPGYVVDPRGMYVIGDRVYVEDIAGAKLVFAPLAGGSIETEVENLAPMVVAVTGDAIYFADFDPAEDGYRSIYRLPREGGEPALVVRYSHDGEVPIGVEDGAPIAKARRADGAAFLVRFGADGAKEVVREWEPAESPTFMRLLSSGELIWCDPLDGLWSAPSVSAEGTNQATGWMGGDLDQAFEGVLVGNQRSQDPEGKHRVFLWQSDGSLEQVAATADDYIGAPRFLVESGVVAVSPTTELLMLTPLEGTPKKLAAADGDRMAMSRKSIATSDTHVLFMGRIGGRQWSLYRIPIPR